jgi:hypothetical protein
MIGHRQNPSLKAVIFRSLETFNGFLFGVLTGSPSWYWCHHQFGESKNVRFTKAGWCPMSIQNFGQTMAELTDASYNSEFGFLARRLHIENWSVVIRISCIFTPLV